MPGNHRCHPTHRTLHLGIPQVVAGVHLLRLGLCQCCLSLQQGIVHGLYADATHHMTLQQGLLVLVVHACRGQTGLSTLTCCHSHL